MSPSSLSDLSTHPGNNLRHPVIIIGAGISGLSAAYFLRKLGIEVLVLEKDTSAGGVMKSIRENGWLSESGPNSAMDNSALLREMIADLGIDDQRVYANEQSKNVFILRGGTLCKLPMTPGEFLHTPLWSSGAKLRLLKEPFIAKTKTAETVAQFFTRRLGKEILDYAVNPFIAGIYAGKPEQLSMEHTFPALFELEERHGSILRGMIAKRKASRKTVGTEKRESLRPRSFSFRNGMETLPRTIAATLGTAVQYGCHIERVVPMRAGKFPVFTVSCVQDEQRYSLECASVIFAAPASSTAEMIRPIDPAMAEILRSIVYSPIVSIYTGYRRNQMPVPHEGFGYLVPEREGRGTLGTLWSSTMYPMRAPEGHFGLTTFIGGARQPGLTTASDEILETIVNDELRGTMGITGVPVHCKVTRWEKAIPQYTPGYGRILKEMLAFEANFRGAFLCSNYRGGISINDCIENAHRMAGLVGKHLALR